MNTCTLAKLILFSAAVFSAAAQEPLPTPWKHQDIGTAQAGQSAQVAGTAKHADGVFTVAGTMDMWAQADGFHFVYQPVQGDEVLVARVVSMDNQQKINPR
jgi:hypothetical protein